MITPENYRTARHRTTVFLYICWLTLSLTPAMVTPPERVHLQGQPEMQQAMDNMVTRDNIIQKRTSSSSRDGSGFQDIKLKTTNLLANAEKALKNLPDSKERHLIESFVERMQEISTMLEKIARNKNVLKDLNSAKRTPVPDGLPKEPKRPAASVIPDINPFQKPISMMSKMQMTSPEINKVLPYKDDPSESQAVTKPVVLSSKIEETENDELVRELESLHDENIHQTIPGDINVVNQAPSVTFPSTSSSSENNPAMPLTEVTEKTKLENKLIEEIEEFHRLGGVMPKEVVDILYADSQKLTDPSPNQKTNADEEMKFVEINKKNKQGMQRYDSFYNEDRENLTENLKNLPYNAGQHFQYWKFNHSFQNKHPNLVQEFPKQSGHFQNISPLNKAQLYPERNQNEDQILQKMKPYNQGRYLDMLHPPGYAPNILQQKLSKSHIFYNGHLPKANYNNYMRHSYGPYPYMHNWNSKNLTIHSPQMTSPHVTNQVKIDSQFSDEMKRELRDGKIIVLSDSVVRSNFKPDNNENTTKNMIKKPQSQEMDIKNKTATEN